MSLSSCRRPMSTCARVDAGRGPAGWQEEFLAFCGEIGLGRLAAQGETEVIASLRELASDPRWRVREGVVMVLRRLGDDFVAAWRARLG